MKIKYALLALVVVICGCKKSNSFSNQFITCLKAKEKHPQKISEMLKSFRIIGLETTEQSLIGGYIGKIKKINGRYFISSDRQELLVFNGDGTFLQKIGGIGNGPGEYASLSDYDILENEDIVILDANKLIVYDGEGTYRKTIPLNFIVFNIKAVSDGRMLLYSSGDDYMIREIDLSGKINKREFRNTQATRLGKNISLVTCGSDKVICQIGRSNDCILYESGSHEFTSVKLLCDDILTASKEEDFIKTHGSNYPEKFPGINFIDGISGCNTHLLFGCGSVRDGFTVQVFDFKDDNVTYTISSDDINDVTFTSPFFMEYACLADARECFVTYVSPVDIRTGLEMHKEFEGNPNYGQLEKMFPADNAEVREENPCLVEFVFK
jgi:hypothetical protein